MTEPETLKLANPPLAAFLGWLAPGLGHIYQGRTGKGILFAACILPLFLTGYFLGDRKVVYLRWDDHEWRWAYLAQVGAGAVALPALAQWAGLENRLPERFRDFQTPPNEWDLDELHRRHGKRVEIAVIYTIIAGLLNMLVVYDAFAGPAMYQEERKHLNSKRSSGGD